MALNFKIASSNKMLSSVTKNSINSFAKKEIIDLPMNMIEENPDNIKVFNMDDIELLAKTISSEGWTGAIEVMEMPNGKYQISSGHRRYRAMKLLDKNSIPCEIIRYVDDKSVARKLLSSNIHNRVMSPLDWGRAILFFIENVTDDGFLNTNTKAQCAEFFGFNDSKMSRYIALTKLIPELQTIADKEGFPATALAPAAKLTHDEQLILKDKLLNVVNNTSSDIREDISSITRDTVVQEIAKFKENKYKKNINEINDNKIKTSKINNTNISNKEQNEKENITAFYFDQQLCELITTCKKLNNSTIIEEVNKIAINHIKEAISMLIEIEKKTNI